jgi:hypothetical protein
MFYFKSCTKCQGDQSLEQDSYGSFLKCLQCGKLVEVDEARDQRSVLHGSVSNETAVTALLDGSASNKTAVRSLTKVKVKTAVAA